MEFIDPGEIIPEFLALLLVILEVKNSPLGNYSLVFLLNTEQLAYVLKLRKVMH